jgi:hypothetical protein
MRRKYKLFDSVVARRDLVEGASLGAWGRGKIAVIDGKPGIAKGTGGVVVELLSREDHEPGVAVEFFDDDGETIDVAFIPESYVRPATEAEMAASLELTRRLNAGL